MKKQFNREENAKLSDIYDVLSYQKLMDEDEQDE